MIADLVLAIDQGTTSTRAIVFDKELHSVASTSVPLEATHPQPGWVEQDPEAILDSVVRSVGQVLREVGGPERIIAAGLDNQGETVVAWDAEDGRALAPAIVWQCRRSKVIVERLRSAGAEPSVRARSGLPLDPYYSAGKLTWLLENNTEVQSAAARGTLRLGTIDAWLTARLDGGDARTDRSTASRTQLLSLATLAWDPELLAWFGISEWTLPRLVSTVGDLGRVAHVSWKGSVPLRAMACDQQAALAGHGAFEPGAIKATYGTGVFVLANAGTRREATPDLETSIAWTCPDGATSTVVQGGVFAAGALIDWLRDSLGLVADAAETEVLARSVPNAAGVRVLPALAGLGAPWWRPDALAVVAGLSFAANRAHIVRAALDGIAHRVADVVESISAVLPGPIDRLRVDGGLTANGYLMQRQADLLGMPVDIANVAESTALGIAGLAGLGANWGDVATIRSANPVRLTYEPRLGTRARIEERDDWWRFVAATADL